MFSSGQQQADMKETINYATLLTLTARSAQWLTDRLLHCESQVEFPHRTNICMIYINLVRVWLFVYVNLNIRNRSLDTGKIPSGGNGKEMKGKIRT